MRNHQKRLAQTAPTWTTEHMAKHLGDAAVLVVPGSHFRARKRRSQDKYYTALAHRRVLAFLATHIFAAVSNGCAFLRSAIGSLVFVPCSQYLWLILVDDIEMNCLRCHEQHPGFAAFAPTTVCGSPIGYFIFCQPKMQSLWNSQESVQVINNHENWTFQGSHSSPNELCHLLMFTPMFPLCGEHRVHPLSSVDMWECTVWSGLPYRNWWPQI